MEPLSQFKWPVSVERTINAPKEKVWDTVSQPGYLELCHPFCASNPVTQWPGPDSVDEIRYLSGWCFERRFNNWIEGVGYDLEIGRRGRGQSSVAWRISSIDEQTCSLRITVRPHALQNMAVVLRWLPHVFWLRPKLRSYLDSVIRGVEWYVTRGEPVPRNQFGRHPWFSQSASARG